MSIKQNQKRTKIAIQTSFRRSFANEAVLSMVLLGLCISGKECSGQRLWRSIFFISSQVFYRKQIELGFICRIPENTKMTSTRSHILKKHVTFFGRGIMISFLMIISFRRPRRHKPFRRGHLATGELTFSFQHIVIVGRRLL